MSLKMNRCCCLLELRTGCVILASLMIMFGSLYIVWYFMDFELKLHTSTTMEHLISQVNATTTSETPEQALKSRAGKETKPPAPTELDAEIAAKHHMEICTHEGCLPEGPRLFIYGSLYILLGNLLLIAAYETLIQFIDLFVWLFTSFVILSTTITTLNSITKWDCGGRFELVVALVSAVIGAYIILVAQSYRNQCKEENERKQKGKRHQKSKKKQTEILY